jgi:uncharacterized paraquat-inducible protein A
MYVVALAELALGFFFYPLGTLAIVALVAALALATWWLWRALNEPRYRRMSEGRCAECGYDLRGSAERCSECGAYFGLGWSWKPEEGEG